MGNPLANLHAAGQGVLTAPKGSRDWADAVRVNAIGCIRAQVFDAKRFADTYDLIVRNRAWTLMNKLDGSFFSTMQEFCETTVPHGLGTPYDKVLTALKLAASQSKTAGGLTIEADQAVALDTVSPDGRHTNGANQGRDAAGRMVSSDSDSSHDDTKRKASVITEKRLRSVLRAPSEVQDLYRAGVIGQVDAAKLGPTKQTPETAAKIRAAVNEACAIVEAEKPATPKAKRDVKRKVNAKVREVLSANVPTPPRSFADLLTRIAKLSSEDQASLVCEVVEHLDAVHLHRVREVLDERTTPARGPGREES